MPLKEGKSFRFKVKKRDSNNDNNSIVSFEDQEYFYPRKLTVGSTVSLKVSKIDSHSGKVFFHFAEELIRENIPLQAKLIGKRQNASKDSFLIVSYDGIELWVKCKDWQMIDLFNPPTISIIKSRVV